MTEQTTEDGPDLFRVGARLRATVDATWPRGGPVWRDECIVKRADLRALLDAPAVHALTPDALRRGVEAAERARRGRPLSPLTSDDLRVAIVAALGVPGGGQ